MQTAHLDLVQPMTLPNQVVTQTVACPVRINGGPVGVDTRPPALNPHGAALRRHYNDDKQQAGAPGQRAAE